MSAAQTPQPTVRYLIVCEDILTDPAVPQQVSLLNLVSSIRSQIQPPYPLSHPELCVFVQLTECRGSASCRVEVVQADSNDAIFQTRTRAVAFPTDPLEVVGLSFRLRNCSFPEAGLYWIQFWYNDAMIAQQPLLLR